MADSVEEEIRERERERERKEECVGNLDLVECHRMRDIMTSRGVLN